MEASPRLLSKEAVEYVRYLVYLSCYMRAEGPGSNSSAAEVAAVLLLHNTFILSQTGVSDHSGLRVAWWGRFRRI